MIAAAATRTHWTESETAAREIFLRALTGCSVERALTRKLVVRGTRASIPYHPTDTMTIDLGGVRRLLVIAMGKCAGSMLAALLGRADIVAGREIGGVLVAPQPLPSLPPGFSFFQGEHPLPGESSLQAARTILDLLDRERPSSETFCFFLISGGASAMVELPPDPSITLEDMIVLHRELVHSGASIAEINCVRKHVSAVKGGRLGRHAAHLCSLTLMVSDVPPEHMDALGSGPTLPDASTVAECRHILHRYGLLSRLPGSVVRLLVSPHLPETPKSPALAAPALVLLSSADLAEQAQAVARSLGYSVHTEPPYDGDYRDASRLLLERARSLRRTHDRICLISVGEVSVQVRAGAERNEIGSALSVQPPRGGRNHHTVLYCGTQLQEADRGLAVLSCGSDGIDGSSPAAGAVISVEARGGAEPEAWRRSAEDALRTFSSFDFLEDAGRSIHTGPTGINLRDLRLVVAS